MNGEQVNDTTGQVKTQIHSTLGTSQLNRGYLTKPRKTDRGGVVRGYGFE
ncbi:type VI secretion system Vgr family protein [Erwiniaceae bacterium CAU 1747]